MRRRAFFGFLGGAAAAGPTLTKSLATEAAAHLPMPSVGYGSMAAVSPVSDGDWRLSRIAQLKRIIAGKDPEAEHNRTMERLYAAESLERFRLDGLRSVSPVHRALMLTNGLPERRSRIQKADAKHSLARFLRGD